MDKKGKKELAVMGATLTGAGYYGFEVTTRAGMVGPDIIAAIVGVLGLVLLVYALVD